MLIWLKNQGKVRYRTFQLRQRLRDERDAFARDAQELKKALDRRRPPSSAGSESDGNMSDYTMPGNTSDECSPCAYLESSLPGMVAAEEVSGRAATLSPERALPGPTPRNGLQIDALTADDAPARRPG